MIKKVKVIEPAIKEKSGKVVKGTPSQSHDDIIKKAGKGAKVGFLVHADDQQMLAGIGLVWLEEVTEIARRFGAD